MNENKEAARHYYDTASVGPYQGIARSAEPVPPLPDLKLASFGAGAEVLDAEEPPTNRCGARAWNEVLGEWKTCGLAEGHPRKSRNDPGHGRWETAEDQE